MRAPPDAGKDYMRPLTRIAAASTLAVFACAQTLRVARAEPGPVFYLTSRAGAYVQYLALTGSGSGVDGYLVAIRLVQGAPGGQVRTQTFAKRNGSVLVFGTYVASPAGDGYALTAASPSGQVLQLQFARSNVQAVNTAVSALAGSARASGSRTVAPARDTADVQARDPGPSSKAQGAIRSAEQQLESAQAVADRLSATARRARMDANNALVMAGASAAQNQRRIDAVRAADEAEQNAASAQRLVELATSAVESARAETARTQGAGSKPASARRGGNDTVGP